MQALRHSRVCRVGEWWYRPRQGMLRRICSTWRRKLPCMMHCQRRLLLPDSNLRRCKSTGQLQPCLEYHHDMQAMCHMQAYRVGEWWYRPRQGMLRRICSTWRRKLPCMMHCQRRLLLPDSNLRRCKSTGQLQPCLEYHHDMQALSRSQVCRVGEWWCCPRQGM